MELPHGIRRLLLALALTLPLAAAAQTDLYARYADHGGVKVASVSNFALDSSSRVDVTLVEAEDDEGWEWMRSEFNIGALTQSQESSIAQGDDVVLFERRDRHDPGRNAPAKDERIDLASSCYLGISYLRRTVFIFCAGTEEQNDAIVALLVKKLVTSR